MLSDKEFQTFLSLLPFRDCISEPIANQLRSHVAVREWRAGDRISDLGRSGIGMIVITEGRARISLVSATAHQVTLNVSRKNEIIYIGGNPTPNIFNNYEFEAEVEVRAFVVHLADYEAMMNSDLRISNSIYASLLGVFNNILVNMQVFLFRSLEQRLAMQLLFEYRLQGTTTITTTHQRVANSIASSREVISRMLKQWEKDGLVTLSRSRITLNSPAKLEKIAND